MKFTGVNLRLVSDNDLEKYDDRISFAISKEDKKKFEKLPKSRINALRDFVKALVKENAS